MRKRRHDDVPESSGDCYAEEPDRPLSQIQRPLSNEDWEELREVILSEARDHDRETAFGPDNINLHAGLQFILSIYQCGRERVLPPEWTDAWKTVHRRKGAQWKQYHEALQTVARLERTLSPFLVINLSQVVGLPISAVLEGEFKVDASNTTKKRSKK